MQKVAKSYWLLGVAWMFSCSPSVDTGRRCEGDACASAMAGRRVVAGGTGGMPGGDAGTAGAPATGTGGTGAIGSSDNALGVHVEDIDGMTIELVTLACAGDCADIEAVAHGGNPPYTFEWDDGSADPARHVCLSESAQLTVHATDTSVDDDEFQYTARTVRADVTATVLDCTSDAGVTAPTVYWVDWREVNLGTPGTANGSIAAPSAAVEVTYDGEVLAASATFDTFSNNFAPPETYLSDMVANAPPNGGMVTFSGETMLTHTIRFSQTVHNPVIALWSVGFGSLGQSMTIEFDSAPTLLSFGSSLYFLPPDFSVDGKRASGIEGNGVLQFEGEFDALSFTVPAPEVGGYCGMTVGIHAR